MTYASLGTTCINKHHILKRFEYSPGCPFDFRITTPDVLISILQTIVDGELDEKIISHSNYKMASKPAYKHYIEHSTLVNFKLIHDYEINKIESKMRHQFDNFMNLNNPTFLWSNAQGDTDVKDSELGIPIEEFYLTESRYDQICVLINKIFGSKAQIKFAVRSEYTDHCLLNKHNVYIADIPKSTIFSEADYGTMEQFDPLFL